MRPTTLCFPVTADGRLLLGRKKRGFGADKWNGFGGKLEGRETFRQCAVRELHEEAGHIAAPEDLEIIGFLDFHFPASPNDDHITYIYFARIWIGTPVETEEMEPRFFSADNLPYDEMWQGDRVWLPMLLKGEKIKGIVTFAAGGEQVDRIEIYKHE